MSADLKKAEEAGNKEKAEALSRTLTAVEAAALQMEKELLFAEMESIVALIDAITAEPAPAPGTTAAAAQAEIVEQLESREAKLLEQIVEKQKES
ncbi:MAG: hypothetical protein K0R28_2250, partial [Paenibacillus sp.]|nr:hypothetical protein [Paenibacillus sp.]